MSSSGSATDEGRVGVGGAGRVWMPPHTAATPATAAVCCCCRRSGTGQPGRKDGRVLWSLSGGRTGLLAVWLSSHSPLGQWTLRRQWQWQDAGLFRPLGAAGFA